MADPDYKLLASQPGDDGVLWRLLDHWRIESIPKWIRAENMRGTPPMVMGPQLGRALAIATVHAADHFTDREAFIVNDKTGVAMAYANYLRAMVLRSGGHKTAGGIVVPPSVLN